MRPSILLAICASTLVESAHRSSVKEEIKQCADDYINDYPSLTKHFSREYVEHMCKHKSTWLKDVKHKKPEDSTLTPDQLKWLKSVWHCDDMKCICDAVPECREKHEWITRLLLRMKKDRRREKRNPVLDHLYAQLEAQIAREILPKSIRKEIRMLTKEQRLAYHRGVNKLKTEMIGNMSKYDIFVSLHTYEYSPSAHFCASFLPWHREYTKNFEIALRQVEPEIVGSPYWDSELDSQLPNPADSVLWTEEFFGSGDGYVESGPYGHWMTSPNGFAERFANKTPVLRILGRDHESPYFFMSGLFTAEKIADMMNRTRFGELTHCIDPFFEFTHGGVHIWVGGHMTDVTEAVNDPIFFAFHSFIDHLWELWRLKNQNPDQRETDYPAHQGECDHRRECRATSQMKPFTIRVADGLSNHYTSDLYNFEQRPTCDNETLSCRSPYLFCDSKRIKCVSKVKIHGNCTGFEDQDVCYESICVDGVCVAREDETVHFQEYPNLLKLHRHDNSTQQDDKTVSDLEAEKHEDDGDGYAFIESPLGT